MIAPVEFERFGQSSVEGGVVSAELLPQCLLDLSLVEQRVWHPGATQSLLQLRRGGVRCWRHDMGCRRPRHRVPAAATSRSRQTAPPAPRVRASPNDLLDQPLLGAE
jgi:hypothetical protein